MKITFKHFLAAAIASLSAISFSLIAGCGDTSQYQLSTCNQTVQHLTDTAQNVTFNRSYTGKNFQVYIDGAISDYSAVDEHITSLNGIADILEEKVALGEIPSAQFTCYICADGVPFSAQDDGAVVMFPLGLSEEEAFGWILSALLANDGLPYGVYAGIAALWLDEGFTKLPATAIEGSFITELQFPLYEENNLPAKQRALAWNFSYTLAADWAEDGGTASALAALSRAELEEYLLFNYNLTLPEYSFTPYSSDYEYKVTAPGLTYYIDRDFSDRYLSEKEFTARYDMLAEWLKDNARSAESVREFFSLKDMCGIEVYLENSSDPASADWGYITSTARSRVIRCYTAGVFSMGYVYHMLDYSGNNGFLRDTYMSMLAESSVFSRMVYYKIFSGQARNFAYTATEKQFYTKAMELYNNCSSEPASPQSFNILLFADCFAALAIVDEDVPSAQLNLISEAVYVLRTYGSDALAEIDGKWNTVEISGKTLAEIDAEWESYIISCFG